MDHKIPNWDEGETNEEAQGASEVGHLKLFAKETMNRKSASCLFALWFVTENWKGKHAMFDLF